MIICIDRIKEEFTMSGRSKKENGSKVICVSISPATLQTLDNMMINRSALIEKLLNQWLESNIKPAANKTQE